MQEVPQPPPVADVYRLVEPVVTPDFIDGVLWQRYAKPSTAAADLACRRGIADLHEPPLDRSARHEVHEDEDDEGDAEKRRHDQQDAPKEVLGHRPSGWAAAGSAKPDQ